MGADSRAHKHLGITRRSKANFANGVQKRSLGVLVLLLMHFLGGKSSDKNRSAVPNDLHDLSGGDFANIHLKIGVPVIPGPSVKSANDSDCVQSAQIGDAGVVECAEHVDLGAADVGFVLIVDSVFVEPVIEGGFEVDVVAEVSRPGRGDEEVGLVGN